LLLGYAPAALAHQHRGAVRYHVHLRLDAVSLAAPHHHARRHADAHHRHQEDDRHLGCADRVADRHVYRNVGDAAAGVRGDRDAAAVRARPDRVGEVRMAEVGLDAVRKVYAGNVEAVKGVTFDVPDGHFCVLVGPSGCGKSTLLRMIAGLETVTTGTVTIGGQVVNEIEPSERDIAMVFQNYALYPH